MIDVTKFVSAVPFPKRIGVGAGAGDDVELPADPTLLNHVGTVHAGALFTLGESASGAALMRALPDLLGTAFLVAKRATIDYKKPASGALHARGALAEPQAAITERLARDGKTTFDVAVSIHDAAETVVATMTVTWYLRRG